MALIDYNATLSGLDNDYELFCRLGEMFCEDTPVLLEELRRHAIAKNSDGTRETLHALKGMVAQFYAGSAVEQLAELENLAKSGDTQTTIHQFDSLQKVIDDLKSEIATLSRT
jgi:HPt (histidine-containing phosphotransfer) domain-containing protein